MTEQRLRPRWEALDGPICQHCGKHHNRQLKRGSASTGLARCDCCNVFKAVYELASFEKEAQNDE